MEFGYRQRCMMAWKLDVFRRFEDYFNS